MQAVTLWRKATRSSGNGSTNCVEARWRKSSRSSSSGNGDCVEARAHCSLFDIRDSKLDAASPMFTMSAGDFRALLDAAARP
ncbi:DUF397 domain-containing protein [Glycomyces sp. A-F 0318]|uniref:DUF397 domain-containing protein n=1 Tax=Glycomyces amatae TaxID=2881355 RepID=UPI001E53097F|nr:DUF397 domain-containing protein [Glycomyces amatae]MCD0445838.1 DUF397 domain-containing protein [Glycomyces amatae]